MKNLWAFFGFVSLVQGFYYQIPTPLLRINKYVVEKTPYVFFWSNSQKLGWRFDECPHMGASLSKGWIDKKGKICCPYHGFSFDGNPEQVFQMGTDTFFRPPSYKIPLVLPYYPEEHFDKSFVYSGGYMRLSQKQDIITENVLDMLHISYVHSFGTFAELPKQISFEPLSPYSGKTTFIYKPFSWTLSNKMGKVNHVIVENEYHLPSTTITRVIAGNLVKTVMTRATPINDKETLFFYRVYRNFWKSESFPFLTVVGNSIMDFLMKKTIEEDIVILNTIYPNRGKGFTTLFDVTIKNYRLALKTYERDSNLNMDSENDGIKNKTLSIPTPFSKGLEE